MAEYIDREATIESIKQNCAGCESYGGVLCTSCPLYDALLQLEIVPAADVAPVVHGEWAFNGYTLTGDKAYSCSECGFAVANIDDVYMKLCPNCGAKMDGGTT